MPNPSADYPTAIHTDTDVSALASQKLGVSSPKHSELEGKQEEEIKAVQTAVGIGLGTPTAHKVIVGDTTSGHSKWGTYDDLLPSQTGNNGFFLTTNGTTASWASTSGGGSSVTSLSNINTAGIGVYDSLSGTNANMRGVESSDGTIGVSLNSTDHTIDLTVNASSISVSSFTGTLAIGHGGTGQTTKTPAFNALSPLTTLGDVMTHDGTNSIRLAGNTTGTRKFLAQTGTGSVSAAPSWLALSAGDIPTLTAVKISDFQSTAQGYTLDTFAAPAGDVSLNSHKVTSLADGTAITDAATWGQVQALAQGLSVKPSAVVATTAGLPSYVYANGSSGVGATITAVATGVLTIDGHTVALNEYVLVKNETSTNSPYNGLYKCTLAGAVGVAFILTRAVEMDASTEFQGAFIFVEAGTANASAGFVCTLAAAPTVGTTNIAFTQFSGAGEITVSAELTKTGNQLSITAAGVTNAMLAGSITAAKLVGSDIATVGTITAGTWNGTVVAPTFGGTGITTYAKGDIVTGSGTNTVAKLAVGTNGYALVADSTQTTGTKWANIPKPTFDAVVAASGGDYTTVTAAITAGATKIAVVGSVTETAQISATSISLFGFGKDLSVITLPDDNTKIAKFSACDVSGIGFIGGTVNLASNLDGWVNFWGTGGITQGCEFSATGSTSTTTGSMVAIGKSGTANANRFSFVNNHFSNNNAGYALISLSNGGQTQGNLIAGNTVNACQKIRFFVYDNTTANQDGLQIVNNTGYFSVDHASGNTIDIDWTGASNYLTGLVVAHNTFRIDSAGTGQFINISGRGNDNTILVTGNSASNSSNVYRDIYIHGVNGGTVSFNKAATMRTYSNASVNFIGNHITTSLTNNGNTSSGCSYIGNTSSTNTNGTIVFTSGTVSNNVFSGNVFGGAISIAGTGNVITNNYSGGNFTITGSAHSVMGNKCGGTYSDTSTVGVNRGTMGSTIGGTIFNSTTTGNNTTTGDTDLFSTALVAGVLGTNGDAIRFTCAGTFAAVANTKQLKVKFGATVLDFTAIAATATAANWTIDGMVIRTGATTQKMFATLATDFPAQQALAKYSTAAETLSGSITLKVTGTGTSTNDIAAEVWKGEFVPAA